MNLGGGIVVGRLLEVALLGGWHYYSQSYDKGGGADAGLPAVQEWENEWLC